MKERLIGAAVLAALGVWLIPLLLDGPDEPIADGGAALELPVPSGHVGEVRTEIIDLSPRREAGATSTGAARATDSVSAESAEADGAQTRTPTASASTTGDRTSAAASDDAAEAAASGAERESAPATQARTDSGSQAAGSTASSSPSRQPTASTPAREAPAQTSSARTETNESGDWAVQVGSFSDEENARRHADRVATFGHSPKISTFRAGGRVMYRVRVGPQATREAAEAVASALTAHGFVAQVVTTK